MKKPRRGGARPGSGNIKDDVSTIILDGDMRRMLNIIVLHERSQRNEKLSHTQIARELIEARWQELDRAWQTEETRT